MLVEEDVSAANQQRGVADLAICTHALDESAQPWPIAEQRALRDLPRALARWTALFGVARKPMASPVEGSAREGSARRSAGGQRRSVSAMSRR